MIALATAAPAHAASIGCGATETRVISATDAARGELTVTIPACATTITFSVLGGAGGGTGEDGGAGALITGTIQPTGADMTVTLIAGQLGWARGSTKVNINPTGYGSGGLGGNRFNYNGNGIWLVDGGYGGAGSAIVTDAGNPVVIAGGGGGAGNASSSQPPIYVVESGAGGDGGLVPAGGALGHVGGGAVANGGSPAISNLPGAGGVAAPGTFTGVNGTAGTAPTSGAGGRGAEGIGESGAKAGGGGGGYAGGGGGSVVYQTASDGAGAGGGAGSNLVASADGVVTVVDAGGITTGSRGQGTVSITWS